MFAGGEATGTKNLSHLWLWRWRCNWDAHVLCTVTSSQLASATFTLDTSTRAGTRVTLFGDWDIKYHSRIYFPCRAFFQDSAARSLVPNLAPTRPQDYLNYLQLRSSLSAPSSRGWLLRLWRVNKRAVGYQHGSYRFLLEASTSLCSGPTSFAPLAIS